MHFVITSSSIYDYAFIHSLPSSIASLCVPCPFSAGSLSTHSPPQLQLSYEMSSITVSIFYLPYDVFFSS